MGFALSQAKRWADQRSDGLAKPLRDFVARSVALDLQRREDAQKAEAEREKEKAEREKAEAERKKAEAEAARLRAEQDAREQRQRADQAELAVKTARSKAKRLRVAVGVLAVAIIAGVIRWQLQALQE